VLFDVISAVWVGAFLGALMKIASPHGNWVSWVFAALVGGFGAVVGLFAARLLGVSREDDFRTLAIAGAFAVIVMIGYAIISRAALRRLIRRTGRMTRPTIAF
jgi:hypothetical protein